MVSTPLQCVSNPPVMAPKEAGVQGGGEAGDYFGSIRCTGAGYLANALNPVTLASVEARKVRLVRVLHVNLASHQVS